MADAAGTPVFLLAQNRLLREALAKVLSRKSDIIIVGSSGTSPECMRDVIAAAPEVLVMDSLSTSLVRTEFARELREKLPEVKLVMIGMEASELHFLQAIRDGALGYVLTEASALEVLAAVRTVAKGGAFCSPELCAFLFRFAARQNQLPNFHVRSKLGLTNREQQLVTLISRGLTNKEIATQLQLAEQTVRNHVHRMLRKLGASHRLAVVDICRMEGACV